MRERAILPVLIDFEIPDDGGKEDDRAFHKEIALLLHPRLVEVEHDGVRRFVSVGNILHEIRVYGIATVAAARVIEVYHVELRLDLLPV